MLHALLTKRSRSKQGRLTTKITTKTQEEENKAEAKKWTEEKTF